MGTNPNFSGFVAADTLFSVLDNRPISADPNAKLLFPLVLGVLAFDTPYNGLSRSMFAYGAFSQYRNISSIWNLGSSVGSLVMGQGAASAASQSALSATASHNPSWQRWSLLASRTGTYGAILAGGVAAYVNRNEIASALKAVNRENISQSWSKVNRENIGSAVSSLPAYVSRDSIGEGFTWMASHLKFVGALMKQAQLQTRLQRLEELKGLGLANLYTSLGENGYWSESYFVPKRTFCAVPVNKDEKSGNSSGEEKKKSMLVWSEWANPDAKDEIAAHCSMFQPEKNLRYKEMCDAAGELVQKWASNDPRNVVDDYISSREQRERSMSEAQAWDDDGKVLNSPAGQPQEPLFDDQTGKMEDQEDESQLQVILRSTELPLPEDGGLSDEDLKLAVEVPLPSEEISEDSMRRLWDPETKTWKERVWNPLSGVSMPSIPTLPQIPQMPAMSLPGWKKHDSAVAMSGDVEEKESASEEQSGNGGVASKENLESSKA